MRTIIRRGFAALMLVVGAQAMAVQLGSTRSTTAVSGYSGAATTAIQLPGAVRAIGTRENGDQPCEVLVSLRPVDPPGAGSFPRNIALSCRTGGSSASKWATLGANNWVWKAQVCTTNANPTNKRRVKGVRIWAARLDASARVMQTNSMAQFERPNCPKNGWRNVARCPANQIAIGVEAHQGANGASGIALVCANVVR